jgi:hypothetical protein
VRRERHLRAVGQQQAVDLAIGIEQPLLHAAVERDAAGGFGVGAMWQGRAAGPTGIGAGA